MDNPLQLSYLKQTNYIVAVKCLALLTNSKELITSATLTEFLGVESSFIRKVLAKLMQEEMVEGFNGRYGGYRILTDPEETSLYDVYIAITKDAYIEVQASEIGDLDKMILSIILESQNEMKKNLSKYTISDLANCLGSIDK